MKKWIEYKGLKLSSKKLKSGNYQVKFYLDSKDGQSRYGYMLTEPRTPVRQVVEEIYQKFAVSQTDIRHAHLYSLGKKEQENGVIWFG